MNIKNFMVMVIGLTAFFIVGAVASTGASASTEVSLSAIAQIESSNNPLAVGDGGKALGMFQLHQGVVDEYNRYHNTLYSHKDALRREISRKMAYWYLHVRIPQMLRYFKVSDSLENRLTAYNMGIVAVRKGRKAHSYIRKYQAIIGAGQADTLAERSSINTHAPHLPNNKQNKIGGAYVYAR